MEKYYFIVKMGFIIILHHIYLTNTHIKKRGRANICFFPSNLNVKLSSMWVKIKRTLIKIVTKQEVTVIIYFVIFVARLRPNRKNGLTQ